LCIADSAPGERRVQRAARAPSVIPVTVVPARRFVMPYYSFSSEFIEVTVDGQKIYIRADDIKRIEEMKDGKTKIVLNDGTEIIVDQPIDYFKESLNTVIVIRTQTR
jgi:hypothetical protein